jgi:hypothetical protein
MFASRKCLQSQRLVQMMGNHDIHCVKIAPSVPRPAKKRLSPRFRQHKRSLGGIRGSITAVTGCEALSDAIHMIAGNRTAADECKF